MKNKLFLSVLAFVFCFTQSLRAQSWNPAAIIESIDGVGGSVGEYNSLAIVNGKPAIAFYDEIRKDLLYKIALDANGTTWSNTIVVDKVGDVGEYASLTVVNGKPAIAYYDATYSNLKYVRANDADGTTWGVPVNVSNFPGYLGEYASLVVVNGNPAVSFYDNADDNLMYARANDPNGDTWNASIIVASTGNVGSHTSLAIINGNPAISYFDVTNVVLKYVRATDIDGNAWGTPLSLDATGGTFTTLITVNGFPAVSYHSSTTNDLKYVRASNADGSA